MALPNRRITLDEYLAHPENRHEEYAAGELVVAPPPSIRHQFAADALRGLLGAACGPDGVALTAAGCPTASPTWSWFPGRPSASPT